MLATEHPSPATLDVDECARGERGREGGAAVSDSEGGGDECASGAAGGAVRKAGERQEATAIVPPASSTGPAKDAPASRQDPAVASISTLAKESADSRGHEFGSQHLALVLRAAFPSKVAMRKFVQEVKAKSEAFKAVQLSSQANGGKYSPEQIAAKIAECRPEQVASAAQLLSWLTVRHTPKAVRIRS